MGLDDFKEQMDPAYQEIFLKTLVSAEVANSRFEKNLSYGASVKRVRMFIDGVRVRNIVAHTNRVIDQTYDTGETLLINKNKGTTFRLMKNEETQAGPLSPAEFAGMNLAMKTSVVVDGDVLYETKNAWAPFDNGDLTTLVSSGTPVEFTKANMELILTRTQAKLGKNLGGMKGIINTCWVVDSYGLAEIAQYLMAKNIDYAKSVFENGIVEGLKANNAEIYVTEALSCDIVINMGTNPTAGQILTVGNFTFTFVSSIGTTAGNVLIGGSVDATRANLVASINAHQNDAPADTANYIVFKDVPGSLTFAGSQFAELRLSAVNDTAGNQVELTGTGSGRQLVSTNVTSATIASNVVHFYYGKKGAIDVVIQDEVDTEVKDDPYQRAKIILSDKLFGIKTFADGKQKFLDVQVKVQ
jgi:hypothetical protein